MALPCGYVLLLTTSPDRSRRYDLHLTRSVRRAVNIPVIASSGAGKPEHFADVFEVCGVEAGLAASIFHKDLVSIAEVKQLLTKRGIATRGMSSCADARGPQLRLPAWVQLLGLFGVGVAIGVALSRR